MKQVLMYLVSIVILVVVSALPLASQQPTSLRREFIRTMAHPNVHSEARREFARRPQVDTMLIAVMMDSMASGWARTEAARVLAHVQTRRACTFIERAVHGADIDAAVLTVLIQEAAFRRDEFGIRLVENALEFGSRIAKLAAISALGALPPDRERRLLIEAANDPDPVVANGARLRLNPEAFEMPEDLGQPNVVE